MLHDPYRAVTLDSFIGWLETMPAEGTYDFWDCDGHCLIGRYMYAMGIAWEGAPNGTTGDWTKSSYAKVGWKIFGDGKPFTVLSDQPWTFGAALERARRLEGLRT